jgi:hypothetical protein
MGLRQGTIQRNFTIRLGFSFFSPVSTLHIPRKRSVLVISHLGFDSNVTLIVKSIKLAFIIIRQFTEGWSALMITRRPLPP